MSKAKLEYIWLDGYEPSASLRSKTKIATNFKGTLEDCPIWSFDASSTRQAEGSRTEQKQTKPAKSRKPQEK